MEQPRKRGLLGSAVQREIVTVLESETPCVKSTVHARSALKPVAFRFITILEVLIGSEMEAGRKTKILISRDWDVKRSRLIHGQENRAQDDRRRERSHEDRNLLILRRGSNKKTGLQIL